jgi:hypothetical protein
MLPAPQTGRRQAYALARRVDAAVEVAAGIAAEPAIVVETALAGDEQQGAAEAKRTPEGAQRAKGAERHVKLLTDELRLMSPRWGRVAPPPRHWLTLATTVIYHVRCTERHNSRNVSVWSEFLRSDRSRTTWRGTPSTRCARKATPASA